MSSGVFFAVLLAALLHASWNALIKTGQNKQTGMLILSLGHAAIGAVVVTTRPFPAAEVWPWLLGSGLIHTAYQLFLAYAYEQGDLSRVYPIARGTAPMIVLAVTGVFAIDPLAGGELAGVLVLGLGIFLMARGIFQNGESRRMLPFALGSACATAGYSLVDGLGARVSGDAVAYVGWLLILSGLFYTPSILFLRGRSILIAPARAWGWGLFAAACSYLAYAIAVWAMTVAPLALVTALRETSILFAVLIGWLIFGERMDRAKAVAALLIVAGVALTRL
ncbi:MAG: EamA family transporter [Rhodobacteraceae bacterium]|nr:EamA family transporter [Paracoccaceae bacterium]